MDLNCAFVLYSDILQVCFKNRLKKESAVCITSKCLFVLLSVIACVESVTDNGVAPSSGCRLRSSGLSCCGGFCVWLSWQIINNLACVDKGGKVNKTYSGKKKKNCT